MSGAARPSARSGGRGVSGGGKAGRRRGRGAGGAVRCGARTMASMEHAPQKPMKSSPKSTVRACHVAPSSSCTMSCRSIEIVRLHVSASSNPSSSALPSASMLPSRRICVATSEAMKVRLLSPSGTCSGGDTRVDWQRSRPGRSSAHLRVLARVLLAVELRAEQLGHRRARSGHLVDLDRAPRCQLDGRAVVAVDMEPPRIPAFIACRLPLAWLVLVRPRWGWRVRVSKG